MLVPLLAATVLLSACGPKKEDKLDDATLSTSDGSKAAPRVATDDRCRAGASHEAVKRELFRRAAEVRGSNGDNYARIGEAAVLVIDGAAPVVAATASQAIDCQGRGTLRLPPGLVAASGRTMLSGDLAFTVGADRGHTVTVGEGDAIIVPLATLTQSRGRSTSPAPSPSPSIDPPTAPTAPRPPVAAPAPRPSVPRPAPVSTNPSFDCDRARAQSEYAVCASPALSALDRTMSGQFRAARNRADPGQARLLEQTRGRFLAFRNRCGDDDCIAQTYRGRMREIDDIMAGRWQPAR